MGNPEPDEPNHGTEYPPLEQSAPATDPHAPVEYPAQPGYEQPAQPQFGYPQPGYEQSGYQQPGYPPAGYPPPDYQQSGYPPPPGYPPSGYPPAQAGYPPQYPYGAYDPYAPARPVGTNGKAIGAFVTSLVGLTFCGLPSFVGLILGIIAMRETKRTGQDGHGLALAGVIIGAIATVLFVIVVIVYAIGIAAIATDPSYY